MSNPAPNNPRRLGVVIKPPGDRGYVFIVGEDGVEYFAHATAFPSPSLFEGLCGGEGVTFHAARTEKGWRANRIEMAVTADELVRLQEMEERRGNS